MLVTRSEESGTTIYGTIGGGHLEFQAAHMAEALLDMRESRPPVQVREMVLGRELAQCCGGVVRLRVERFTREDLARLNRIECIGPSRPALWLFGAGHVGHALVRVLADLPFEVTWIDPRPELFSGKVPDNVRPLCVSEPLKAVDSAPAGALFLVMTHDHALDFELCRKVLGRCEFGWLGLIGSKSKGARFRSRLARAGMTAEQIERLTCPIGIEGVSSKLPAAIAVAVAAQLLRGVVPAVCELELASGARMNSAAVAMDPCGGADCAACSSGPARASEPACATGAASGRMSLP
jgi:xanthine dehydrogenase accessory factor